MALHPQVQKILDAGKRLPPLETLSVKEARKRCRDAFVTRGIPLPVYRVEDTSFNIFYEKRTQTVPIRIYKPTPGRRFPVLVYFHGGGFVLNNLDTHDGICRSLCKTAECIVVSVDYALAPENPYPTALHQCYTATKWVMAHAAGFGGAPGRIAVAGDSSGGMLAAGVTLMARDLGLPDILFQLLIYPSLDYYRPGTPSYRQYGEGYSLTREIMAWFFELYLGKQQDMDSPYLFPSRASDLSRLPPTHIITAEYDPLRDEAEIFANRVEQAGIKTTCKRYNGMIHGFIIMHQDIDMGKTALLDAGRLVKSEFNDHDR